jgi:acyl-CoA synthetase (AMP-forming)/AMP-acid ligase II
LIPGVVKEAARRFGDQVAFVTPEGWTVSYRDLYKLSESIAARLVRRGIKTGDVVALNMRASPDYVVAYLASARVGAITTGLNPRFQQHDRAAVIARAQPKLVISADDLLEGLPADLDVETVMLATDPEKILPTLRDDATIGRLPIDRERPVTIVFTSGTTGEPKGALFRNRQLAAITMFDTGGVWGTAGQGQPMLSSTELPHIAFMTKLPWYLRTGARFYMLARWRAADALEAIATNKMATIGAIPAQLALMLRHEDFDKYDFSAVKAIIVGAGPSSPALIHEARKRFGAPYSVRYSSTESGGVGTLTAFDAPDEETLFTVGRPREGIDLVVRDENGDLVTHNEVGEVTLQSPAMLSEYWNDHESTAQTIKHGWLYTGDLGYVDHNGCLRLAGRSKEMFIRGGYNVYPMEVEAVLASHPAVAQVAVVPRPDDVMGEIGVAVVVPRHNDRPPSLEEIREFGGRRLAAYKLPEDIRIVDALPLTAMQKVDRQRLQTEASDGASDK